MATFAENTSVPVEKSRAEIEGTLARYGASLMGATHEVIVAALDPREVPLLDDPAKTRLAPLNFAGQWVVQTRNPVDADREAAAKIAGAVDEILAGVLSPDTDFVREWVKRFSDSNLK